MRTAHWPVSVRLTWLGQIALTLWLGAWLFFDPAGRLVFTSYYVINEVLPLQAWGAIFLVLGLGYLGALKSLRWYGFWSVSAGFVYAAWSALLFVAWLSHDGSAVIGMTYAFVALTNLSVYSYSLAPRPGTGEDE